MIRYALRCDNGHDFEAWFKSGGDFDQQAEKGYLACPVCASTAVGKAVMAPSVRRAEAPASSALPVQAALPDPEKIEAFKAFVRAIRNNSEQVGERFPEEARKIHYGEAEARGIIGQASPDDVAALVEEGIDILPLPALPEDAN